MSLRRRKWPGATRPVRRDVLCGVHNPGLPEDDGDAVAGRRRGGLQHELRLVLEVGPPDHFEVVDPIDVLRQAELPALPAVLQPFPGNRGRHEHGHQLQQHHHRPKPREQALARPHDSAEYQHLLLIERPHQAARKDPRRDELELSVGRDV